MSTFSQPAVSDHTAEPVTASPLPYVITPPLAEVQLNLPGSDIYGLFAVLERDDTEQETPYVGIGNGGGMSVDLEVPEDVRAYARQIIRFAEQVTALADQLAAMQAGGA